MPTDSSDSKAIELLDEEGKVEYVDKMAGSPTAAPRACTDVGCCIVFAFLAVGLFFVYTWGAIYGDLGRFQGLPDSTGQVCGVDAAVINMPYLYWCKDQTGELSNEKICVDICRDTTEGSYTCPGIPASPVYPTQPFAGLLCLPNSGMIEEEIKKMLGSGRYATVEWYASELSEVVRAWPAVMIPACCALFLSAFYMWLMETSFEAIITVALGVAAVMLAFIGGDLIWKGLSGEGYDGIPGTGDTLMDMFVAAALGCAAIAFSCAVCRLSDQIKEASKPVKACAAFIRDNPSMYGQIYFAVFIRLAFFSSWMVGLMDLISAILVPSGSDFVMRNIGGFISFYIFMGIWILEVMLALNTFVVAYLAEIWFFQSETGETIGPCSWCKPYAQGITYHMGTFALGSFLMICTQIQGWIFERMAQGKADGNTCCTCLAKCCSCCLACFERFLKHLSRLAYADVAMNANPYCVAAKQSLEIIDEAGGELVYMNGALFVVTFAGMSFIYASGMFMCHMIVTLWPAYSNPSSEHYIQDPAFISMFTGFVCCLVSVPIFFEFKSASNAFVYCLALQEKRNSAEVAKAEAEKAIESGSWRRSCDFSGATTTMPGGQTRVLRPSHTQHPEIMALMETEDSGSHGWGFMPNH